FCEILPNREGLCHVSELSHGYVKKVSDEVKVGDEVTVKVIGIDDLGRVNLSIKQATPKPEGLDDAKDDRGKGPKKDRK
ncbi:MAG: S1 RNA-binding domain-containing protein, partial [Candidatus Omnitrophota bacterium]